MDSWRELEKRVKTHSTIDNTYQEMQMLKKRQWNEVMKRLISIVCHLAERNLAFRGHNSNLHETNNGNFLGVVELLAEFDPVMSEHVRRAETKEIADHYLGKMIQRVKQSHYYSVIMDCTPVEQLSVTLRFVKCQIVPGLLLESIFCRFPPST